MVPPIALISRRAQLRPYNSNRLRNISVSGVLIYFGSSVPMVRPPNATTFPLVLKIGNITRPLKKSSGEPLLDLVTTPDPITTSAVKSFLHK